MQQCGSFSFNINQWCDIINAETCPVSAVNLNVSYQVLPSSGQANDKQTHFKS